MEKELPACPTCGKEQDSLRGDTDDRACHRCRSTEGLMAGVCLAIEANGSEPGLIEGWPALRLLMRERFGPTLSDSACLDCLKDLLLVDNGGDREAMLRTRLSDVVSILGEPDTPDTLKSPLEVDVASEVPTVEYKGKVYSVNQEQAELLQELSDSYPVRKGLTNEMRKKPSRVIKGLPDPLKKAIDTTVQGSVLRCPT